MEPSQILDALSASFFGLLGIWAAVVRRHWFLRLAVVGSMLLGALLIPAYQVVVEFGIQMSLIMLGVWWARDRKDWQPRLSVETALLTMVVVAVAAAVAARLPDWKLHTWSFLLGVGFGTAAVALLCLWTVFGQARLSLRIAVLIFGAALFLVLFHFGSAITYALRMRGQTDWVSALVSFYEPQYVQGWIAYMAPTTLLGVSIILAALVLGRASGLFCSLQPSMDGAGESSARVACSANRDRESWRVRLARVGLVAVFALVALPLVYIFYRLMTPTPLPSVELPQPNGYDDFVAAGLMTPRTTEQLISMRPASGPKFEARLEQELALTAPVLDRLALGLRRECYANPAAIKNREGDVLDSTLADETEAVLQSANLVFLQLKQSELRGTNDERLRALSDAFLFGALATRGAGIRMYDDWFSWWPLASVHTLAPEFSGAECSELARRMLEIDTLRQSWEEKARLQRMRDENRSWESRLRLVLDDISGVSPYQNEHDYYRRALADYRIAAVKLGLRAYFLENGRLPTKAKALVPEYLPEIPNDPFAPGWVKYRLASRDVAVLYCLGPDGDDDGGTAYTVREDRSIDEADGDQVVEVSLSELGIESPPDE